MSTAKIEELKVLGRDAQAAGDFELLERVLDKIESEQAAFEERQSTEAQRIYTSTGVFPDAFYDEQGGIKQASADELGIERGSVGGFVESAADTARALGTGALAEIGAGYADIKGGLESVMAGEEFYKGIGKGEELRDLLTYRPSTPEGEKVLEEFSGYIQTGADAVGLAQTIKWLEETGKEGAAAGESMGLPPSVLAFIESTPQILPELLAAATQTGAVKQLIDTPQVQKILQADVGAPVEAGVDYVSQKVAPLFTEQSSFKQELGRKIKEGSRDPVTAKWMLEDERTVDVAPEQLERIPSDIDAPELEGLTAPEGVGIERIKQAIELEAPRVQKDALASEAIKQGFDEGVIASLKAASPTDRRKMRAMVTLKEAPSKDAVAGMRVRASDVVGDSIKDRVVFLANKKREAGKAIDEAARNLKGKQVAAADAFNGFADGIQDLDITFDIDTKKPVFEGSMLEGDTASQKILETVISRAKSAARNGGDAYELHKLKRFIDNKVSYGVSKEGLSGDAERVVKSLRRSIDEALDNADADYDAANTMYADTKSVIDALQDVAGKKVDLEGVSADKALGTLSRRVMSNAQSRARLIDALDEMEVTAKKYGAEFDDDIMVQALFFDELDSVFKPSARTSLHGELSKVAERGARAAAQPSQGALDVAVGAVGKAVKRAQGINEKNAYKAIKELLERE